MTSKMAMYTIRGCDKPPDIVEVAKVLKVSVEDIDASFGVVSVDQDQGLYCVMADYNKVSSSFGKTKQYEGPWSTPGIQSAADETDSEPP